MSDALLASDILSWLRDHARGHANAKPRRMLRDYLDRQGHSLPLDAHGDCRKLRLAYKDMPEVGSSLKGLFLIVTAEDRRIAQGQLVAPAASMFERKRRIEGAAEGQMELFGV